MYSFLFACQFMTKIISNVSFELIRKLAIKQIAHKKVDCKKSIFRYLHMSAACIKKDNASSPLKNKQRLLAGNSS